MCVQAAPEPFSALCIKCRIYMSIVTVDNSLPHQECSRNKSDTTISNPMTTAITPHIYFTYSVTLLQGQGSHISFISAGWRGEF